LRKKFRRGQIKHTGPGLSSFGDRRYAGDVARHPRSPTQAIHTVKEYVDVPEFANGCRLAVALATLEE
jgi:hypothetical protein